MWSAAAVVVCALDMLGRSAGTFPPIALVNAVPSGASTHVEAFVLRGESTIYLVTSSPVFREALASRLPCGRRNAIRKLASILVHEEWHVRHGSDERKAYQAQLIALVAMGAGHDSPVYAEVSRSMRAVASRRAEASLAALRPPR